MKNVKSPKEDRATMRLQYGELAIRLHRVPVMLYRADKFHVYEARADMAPRIRDIAALVDGIIRQLADTRFCPSKTALRTLEAYVQLHEGWLAHMCEFQKGSIPWPREHRKPEVEQMHCRIKLAQLHHAQALVRLLQKGLANGTYRWSAEAGPTMLRRWRISLDDSEGYFRHAVAHPGIQRELEALEWQTRQVASDTMDAMIREIPSAVTVVGMPDLLDSPTTIIAASARQRVGQLTQRYRSLSLMAEYDAYATSTAFFFDPEYRPTTEGLLNTAYEVTTEAEMFIRALADNHFTPDRNWLDAGCLRATYLKSKYSLLAEYVHFNPHQIFLDREAPTRWPSFCARFAGCLRRMEATMQDIVMEMKKGAFSFGAAAGNTPAQDVVMHGLSKLRQIMLADLASAEVPSYDRLCYWTSSLGGEVQALAFQLIDGLLIPSAPVPFPAIVDIEKSIPITAKIPVARQMETTVH